MKNEAGYAPLLSDARFSALLCILFTSVFNLSACLPNAGISGAALLASVLLFSGYAGEAADRFPKARVLRNVKACEVAGMLLGLAAWPGDSNLLVPVVVLLAALSTFAAPAIQGMLAETVPESNLSRANGLLGSVAIAALAAGLRFGAFATANRHEHAAGAGAALLAMAVLGWLASYRVRQIPAASGQEALHWNPLQGMADGARAIRQNRSLTVSVLGVAGFFFFGTLVPLLAAGAESATALAGGLGAGALAAGTLSGRQIEPGLAPLGAFSTSLCLILWARATHSHHALLHLLGFGVAAGVFAIPLTSWLQQTAPARERGRVLATSNLLNAAASLTALAVLRLLPHHNASHLRFVSQAVGLTLLAGAFLLVAALPLACFRFLMRSLVHLLFSVDLTGEENIPRTGPALLIANHVSYADALFVGLTTPRTARFMMRRIYYEMPVARHVFRMLKAVPVEEVSPRTITIALRDAHAVLEAGHLFALFPEGHITLDGEIADFKRGYERIVRGLQVPIVPIGIDGLWGHPFSCKGGDAFRSWEKPWRPRVTIRVGTPIWAPIAPEELRARVVALASGPPPPLSDTVSPEIA